MKNAILTLALIGTIGLSVEYEKISTTAGVCLIGGVIKSQDEVIVKKYKRKDCPVCKGKGWYISGDGIAKVDCGYCEPESETNNQSKDSCQKTEIIKG